MADLRVLVVGASIAGPMAAYWLAKAGAQVTVIERYPSLRKGGQVVDVRHSGVTIVRRVPKLEALLIKYAAPLQGMSSLQALNWPDPIADDRCPRLADGRKVRPTSCRH